MSELTSGAHGRGRRHPCGHGPQIQGVSLLWLRRSPRSAGDWKVPPQTSWASSCGRKKESERSGRRFKGSGVRHSLPCSIGRMQSGGRTQPQAKLGNASLNAWEGREAGVRNTAGYLLQPEVSLYLHSSCALGQTRVRSRLSAGRHASVLGKSGAR